MEKREIKFRAYDKINKRYGAESYLAIDGEGLLGYSSNIIIEQYTGLKDKNGVEIYEGDIVHISRAVLEEENGMTTDIYFENGAFRYRHKDGSGSVVDWNTTRVVEGYESITQDVEVIGNIHEKA